MKPIINKIRSKISDFIRPSLYDPSFPLKSRIRSNKLRLVSIGDDYIESTSASQVDPFSCDSVIRKNLNENAENAISELIKTFEIDTPIVLSLDCTAQVELIKQSLVSSDKGNGDRFQILLNNPLNKADNLIITLNTPFVELLLNIFNKQGLKIIRIHASTYNYWNFFLGSYGASVETANYIIINGNYVQFLAKHNNEWLQFRSSPILKGDISQTQLSQNLTNFFSPFRQHLRNAPIHYMALRSDIEMETLSRAIETPSEQILLVDYDSLQFLEFKLLCHE